MDFRWLTRHKHNYLQMIFIIVTALVYLLHTLRAYIPSTLLNYSRTIERITVICHVFDCRCSRLLIDVWASMSARPITRVYTSDLRPSIIIESLLLRLAENWQVCSSFIRPNIIDHSWYSGILVMLCRIVHTTTYTSRLYLSNSWSFQ
jgi:hypothetical protein